MKTTKKSTKFIASLNNKSAKIEEIAKILDEDGVKVNHVSSMLGYISGKANVSIEELQAKYESKGLKIELDSQVSIK